MEQLRNMARHSSMVTVMREGLGNGGGWGGEGRGWGHSSMVTVMREGLGNGGGWGGEGLGTLQHGHCDEGGAK